jgi:hypothetical protein
MQIVITLIYFFSVIMLTTVGLIFTILSTVMLCAFFAECRGVTQIVVICK